MPQRILRNPTLKTIIMNRRQALKNIGLGAGILVVGPSTLSLLQSCKNEPQYDWQPTFLTAVNGFALKRILDVIIPTTETPGASDLNIAEFIDSYMEVVATEERQEEFRKSADAFAGVIKSEYGKELSEVSDEEFEKIVAKFLKATPEQRDIYTKRLTETQDPMDKDPEAKLDFEAGSFNYLNNIRDMGIWAWKTSEFIGEQVLYYDPVPGLYIPCGPLEELTNGKAMSL